MQGRTRFLLALILCAFVAEVKAQIISDYTSNADGWTAPSAYPGMTHSTTGGNPTGHISGTPFSFNGGAGTIYFAWHYFAPGKFTGNRQAYYNGTLRYDLQVSGTGGTANPGYEIMLGSNTADTIYYYPPAAVAPTTTWTTNTVVLNNSLGYWKVAASATAGVATEDQVQKVMTDLDVLQIRGLYRNSGAFTRLDNVTMAQPINITTQPQPASVCAGQIVTLTTAATNNPNITYRWQFVAANGVWTDLNNGGAYSNVATANLSINTTGNAGAGTYRARVSGALVVDAFSNQAVVTVNSLPTAPTTTGASSCLPGSVTLSASGASNGVYVWYPTLTATQPLTGPDGGTYVTPVLTTTTTYYVSVYNFQCYSTRIPVTATIGGGSACNKPPVFQPKQSTAIIQGSASINLIELVSDPDNNLNLNSFTITKQPASGATATISQGTLKVDYANRPLFAGKDSLTLRVCDNLSACTEQILKIDVAGDIKVYNAVSPNKNGKNDIFYIEYIDVIPNAKKNRVSIFNRWGDLVWEGNDYDNTKVVFSGRSKDNGDLPSGTYYYKIDFADTKRKQVTGYLEIKN